MVFRAGSPMTTTMKATMAKPSTGSNLCVDVTGASTSTGTKLQQWGCSGNSNQLFNFVPSYVSYTLYYTITDSVGHCWDLTGPSFSAGTPVQMWTCTGGSNQMFQISQTTNGWVIRPFYAQGMCLDISSGSASNGAAVQIWTCNDTPAQVYNFNTPSAGKYFDSLTRYHQVIQPA